MFDIDLNSEIDRIEKDMNVKENGYPIFWKHIKDSKNKTDKKFDSKKINKKLKCPMNYLVEMKFESFRDNNSTLPMSYFFKKFELEESRRKSKKVEELIQNYSLDLFNLSQSNEEDYLLMRSDFEEMIENIKKVYISDNYLGLYSWLIDRAFLISDMTKRKANTIKSNTNKNKSILVKVLYTINRKNLLSVFSNNQKNGN